MKGKPGLNEGELDPRGAKLSNLRLMNIVERK
jgi:hypothetical protein